MITSNSWGGIGYSGKQRHTGWGGLGEGGRHLVVTTRSSQRLPPYPFSPLYPRADFLKQEIQNAQQRGQLFVVASGNSGQNLDAAPLYPASYDLPNMISVASTGITDQVRVGHWALQGGRVTTAALLCGGPGVSSAPPVVPAHPPLHPPPTQLSSFSNLGANSVDIAAPGEAIYSTTYNGQYGLMWGEQRRGQPTCPAVEVAVPHKFLAAP